MSQDTYHWNKFPTLGTLHAAIRSATMHAAAFFLHQIALIVFQPDLTLGASGGCLLVWNNFNHEKAIAKFSSMCQP